MSNYFRNAEKTPPTSWRKDKLIKFYIEHYPDLSCNISEKLVVGNINNNLTPLIPNLKEQLSSLEQLFLTWLNILSKNQDVK